MALAASTRSVYRSLVRAGNSVFEGDAAALGNFRGLIRETFQSPILTSSRLAAQPQAPPPPTSCGGASTSSSSASTSDPSSTFNAAQTPTAAAVESASPGEQAPAVSGASGEGQISQEEYEAKLQHWREVAEILRRNVVQGRATEETGEETAYRLRITKHTELGDNSTIKSPPKLPTTPFPNRNRRRRRQAEATTEDGEVQS